MHFRALILAVLAGLGACATNKTIPELFADFPSCGILAYADACEDVNCNPTKLSCVCPNPASLTVKMGIRVGKDCDRDQKAIDEDFDSGMKLAEICERFDHANPPASEMAAASSLIASRVSSVRSSASVAQTAKATNAAPVVTQMPLAVVGAAAVAVLAL